MGGLLLRAVGGALAGAGDAMVTRAKQAREDTLLALKRSQEVEDRDAGFKQQDAITDKTEAGANQRSADSNQTSRDNTAANNTTSITTTGMNNATSKADTAATEAGANSRNEKTIGAQKDIARMRTDSYNKKTEAVASQYSNGKALTWNQALATARQAYKDNPGAFVDDSNNPVPPDRAISDIATSLMQKQPAPPILTVASPGGPALGGLMSNFAPSPSLSLPSAPAAPAAVAPPPSITPPPGAVDMLKKNPSLKADFDQKYGQGAAARALGQ